MTHTVYVDGWRRNIRFSAAHCILGHETCGNLHGHTYAISARVQGELQPMGMVMDFTQLSQVLKNLAEQLDHKTLIPSNNTVVNVTKETVTLQSDCKTYSIPRQDCVLLPMEQVTAEELATYIASQVQQHLTFPKTVTSLEIIVDEGYGYSASTTLHLR